MIPNVNPIYRKLSFLSWSCWYFLCSSTVDYFASFQRMKNWGKSTRICFCCRLNFSALVLTTWFCYVNNKWQQSALTLDGVSGQIFQVKLLPCVAKRPNGPLWAAAMCHLRFISILCSFLWKLPCGHMSSESSLGQVPQQSFDEIKPRSK